MKGGAGLLFLWYRTGYRPWARLLHRVNLHHTREYGPLADGRYMIRCEWCGLFGQRTPAAVRQREMREALAQFDDAPSPNVSPVQPGGAE